MKKAQEHDVGPNLVDEFVSLLVKNGIRVEILDGNNAKINDNLCLIKHSNASRKPPNQFSTYFWGIGKEAFEEMSTKGYKFFILIGGRNLGKKAQSKILNQEDISKEEEELIKSPRVEHVFIIPFEIFNKLIQELTPTKTDQLKINVYIDEDFELVVSGIGSTNKIPGDEIRTEYLNKLELFGLDAQKSTELKDYLKSMSDKFKDYFVIYRRYKNILDKKVEATLEKEEKDEIYADEILPGVEEEVEKIKETEEGITHTSIEGLLIELGNCLGYDTYTVDTSRVYKDKTLGEISAVSNIPTFIEPRLLNTVKVIDVIWFENNFPVYAFEVEHTTEFSKGLQRLYQLRYFGTKFFLVATMDRKNKYETEIKKDPYFSINEKFHFLSYEELLELFRAVKDCYSKGAKAGILWRLHS